jgi:protein-disulfide isomerase/uncharacterized membrane protein
MKYFFAILVVAGLAVSGYLLYRHLALANPLAQTGSDFCSAFFGTGCDDALRSPLAVQLGLPLAGWGLVYYGTLVALLLLSRLLGPSFRFEAMTAALLLALGGAVGSIALFTAMVTSVSPFCPLCATVHVINILLLWVIKRLSGQSLRQSLSGVATAVKYLATGKTVDPIAARWKSVGLIAVALVAVAIYQWVFVEYASGTQANPAPFDPQQIVAQFEASVQQDIPVNAVDPTLGPADAPVRMVVFSDFRCPGCRKLAQMIPALAKQFEESLRIVFKHYPLDSTCNPAVKKEFHPGACKAAQAAEAARDQGRFWTFHDALFAKSPRQDVTLKSVAEGLHLDLNRFEQHRSSNVGLTRIQADIDLGTRLGVDGTPSVFINGRRVYDIRPKTLLLLIAHEIHAAGQDFPADSRETPMAAR